MTGVRRFSLSSPDWGQDHLSLDAVVAYVDDELSAGAHTRAQAHLACCPECRAEVVAQRQARAVLRAAGGPCLPSSLLRSLRSIPVETELPPPPPGLGITADGQFVLLRDVPPAGPADGAAPAEPRPGAAPRRFSRRARYGAVSGLAVGALAAGALAAPAPTTPAPTTPAEQGVIGGAVLNIPALARSRPAPAAVPAVDPTAGDSPTRADPTRADPTGADPTRADPTGANPDGGNPTGANPDGADPDSTPAVPPPDTSALDPRLRARLDNAPIAFHRR